MTTLVMTYTWNPLKTFWKRFNNFCEVVGYSRAAAHLAQNGFYEEAAHCMDMVKKLRD